MGAAVGSIYAAAFPEQVERLVLLEGAGPLARNPRDVAHHIRRHVAQRQRGTLQPRAPRVYPDLDTAVRARCQTARTFPGNQYLSTEAATEMVLRGSEPARDDGAEEGSTGIRFRHDPRLQWPSLLYFSVDQTNAIYQDVRCPTALYTAREGWPFEEDVMGRVEELLKPVAHEIFPGSHHFHADPDTAQAVIDACTRFLDQEV